MFICRGNEGLPLQHGGTKLPKRESSISENRLAPPNHRGRREICLPLSRQVETSFLSRQEKEDYLRPDCLLYLFKRWKRAYAQEERVELPPTFKKRNLVRRPAFKIKRVSPPPHAPKQAEIPPQLALVRKLLLQESLDLLVSLHLL